MFSSSLTDEPVAAGLGGVVILLPFWLAGSSAELVELGWLRTALRHLALSTHMESFTRGVVDTSDLAWFGLFTLLFLFLTWRSVESRRWR